MDNPSGSSFILVPQSEWEDLRATSREARLFAQEARDSSRENHLTLVKVVAPKLALVDRHEKDIQRGKGALWTLGVVGSIVTLGLAALPFVVR